MKRLLIAGATVAAAAAAVPAQAAPVIFFTPGVYNFSAVPYTTSNSVFESFEAPAQTVGNAPVFNANESGTGTLRVQSGNIPNTTADPDPANVGGTQYLAIGANNGTTSTFTYAFTTPVQFLSFILGSLDTYNSLTLNFVGGGSQTYLGGQIIGAATPGAIPGVNGNGNSTVGGRVSYDAQGGASIASATFGSTFAAFEIDALASAVPEPGSWALMIFGVGMAGASLRTRRRKVTFATA